MTGNMKHPIVLLAMSLLLLSCEGQEEVQPELPKIDWQQRETSLNPRDSLRTGKSYLPVYSRIYHHKRDKTFNLTITASIRNVSATDTVYLIKADLYGTTGDLEHSYLDKPVFIKPMETLEIVIEEEEEEGGTGGNFTFDWAIADGAQPPLFEAVMISTLGQQGVSFTTRAIRVE